jgi:ABC-2 type transport system permease protein
MKPFIYHILIQWKLDIRNKNVLLPIYIIPLVFFLVMSAVFTSVLPGFEDILIPAMITFSVTMGAVLGLPIPLHEIYATDIKKTYKLGNIPSYIPIAASAVTFLIHFFTVSLIVILFGSFIYGAAIPSNLGVFMISLFLFIISCEGIGIFIGTHFKSNSGMILAGQVVFLPSILFSGAMFPSDLLPTALQWFAKIFPASIGMETMTSATLKIGMLSLLLGLTILTIVLSIFRVRRPYQ